MGIFKTYSKNTNLEFTPKVGRQVIYKRYFINSTHYDEDGCMGFYDEPIDEWKAQFFEKMPKIKCKNSSPSFLYITNDKDYLKIDREKVKHLNVRLDYCKYASLTRADEDGDFNVVVSAWSNGFTDSMALPKEVEHIWGQCYGGWRKVGTSYISVIRKNVTLEKSLESAYAAHVKRNKPKETLSILLIGIDATSKLNFARHMPLTKSFLLTKGGIEFYKLNKVGQNTFPNVIPLLTGYSEEEFFKYWKYSDYFDVVDHLFLWEKARKVGYRTSAIFDKTEITAFHYLKKSWNRPTFHYYNRPVVVQSEKMAKLQHDPFSCIGDTNMINLYYDYWLQLAGTFNNTKATPYFGYSFFAEATHNDINMASSVDEIYADFFKTLYGQSSLNNTLVVFFSDHGSRYGDFRATFEGMLEDSNPFLLFIFPPWFEAKYPKIMSNFRKNQHRLITNFNVHATIIDILDFQGDDIVAHKRDRSRGASLFHELPQRRTCEETGIPLKYCNCRNFSTAGISEELTRNISTHFLEEIIAKSKDSRDECVKLTLDTVVTVLRMYSATISGDLFQFTIKTSPGGGLYEATLVADKKTRKVSLIGDIARTNMYRGQADCVENAYLRPFCYCRNLL